MGEREAIDRLRVCQQDTDTEAAHADADDVLCAFLKELGYGKVVEEYHKVRKWYA
jgi:hypothetical protein